MVLVLTGVADSDRRTGSREHPQVGEEETEHRKDSLGTVQQRGE